MEEARGGPPRGTQPPARVPRERSKARALRLRERHKEEKERGRAPRKERGSRQRGRGKGSRMGRRQAKTRRWLIEKVSFHYNIVFLLAAVNSSFRHNTWKV